MLVPEPDVYVAVRLVSPVSRVSCGVPVTVTDSEKVMVVEIVAFGK